MILRLKICASGLLLVMAVTLLAGAGETAPFQVLKTDGKFELRQYPALTLVEASQNTNADSNFMRLFRFIGGHNETRQKIAMTTPVFLESSSTNAAMAFVMPQAMSVTNTPRPMDRGLVIREMSPGPFAVLRFKGYRSAKNEANALAQLRGWMKAQDLPENSPPIFAYFNPPWTLWFLRHNEVMIRVGQPQP